MRLNADCVRDILLSVEDVSEFYKAFHYKKSAIPERLSKYTHEEIIYHIKQCSKSNLIDGVTYYDGATGIDIGDLTPDGHKFLANIREEKIWSGVKSIAKKVGSTSLSAFTQIASNVVTELIKQQFISASF